MRPAGRARPGGADSGSVPFARGGTALLFRRGARVVKLARAGFEEVLAREAAALAAIDHPGVVRMLERAPEALTLVYVPGRDLCRATLPPRKVLRVALDVAGALAAVHAAGFVHGDVSPSNVRVARDGRATLLDFGSARPIGHLADVARGKRAYLAPEQTRAGTPVDGRADLYALGVILAERLGDTPLARRLAAADPRDRPRTAEQAADLLEAALRASP